MIALEDQRPPAEKRRKSKKKAANGGGAGRRFALLAAGALLCGGGFWATVTLNAGPAPEMTPEPVISYELLRLGEIYVNVRPAPSEAEASDKLVRLNISLVYDQKELAKVNAEQNVELSDIGLRRQISADAPILKDSFLSFLRQLQEDELVGSAGMEFLKSELLKRARLTVGHDAPRDVLISELIIQ